MVLNPVLGKLVSKRVVLASASPRRQEILTNVGLRFEVVPSWFKETLEKSSFAAPFEYAVETARQKALEVANRMHVRHMRTPDVVIGADTIVSVDEQILEKPVDKQDAYRMLSRLNGKEHSVFTGVAIIHCHSKDSKLEMEITDFYEETKVKFSDLSEELLWEYIHSGEPMDKAGGYGIQALGGMLVEYVHGDFLNVMGFPLNHFCKKLAELYYPPSKHNVQHKKYDSIPSVDTFENLSDGESESSNFTEHKGASKLDSSGKHSSGGVYTSENSSGVRTGFTVPLENQNGVSQRAPEVPSKILELMDGFRASKALLVASKLKIFDHLKHKGPAKAVDIANDIGTSVCGTERLLDACAALGLLEKTPQGYSNTDSANTFLTSDGEYSLHGYIIHSNDHLWPLFTNLESAVKEGSRQNHRAFGKKAEDLFKDYYHSQEGKQRFMAAMHSIARLTARDVATAFDLSRFKSACDLGGCTGALAHELVQIYPNLKVTVFDLPEVIANISYFQPSGQHTASVTFVSGDFFKDNLPEADLYILSRILHDWPDEKIHVLLSKISALCRPGSALLVAETVLDEQKTHPSRAVLQSLSITEGCAILLAEMVLDDEKKNRSTALLQSLNMLVQTEGKERSGSEYQALLEQHGFTNVKIRITGNLLDVILCVKT
ncbi:probable bifunctional dTTP/UTP pyrophosphatase/methyltransferase protein isoform X1 [Chiroxiphia lanceolata]|uniref:probable bifunctional dTTP/UTP pyrophosphatase/methyltransferase protein isoform X1 n=2 Tax=Chiroxiphia lanceolata TaxID=296741 RepID=UPI0013CE4BFC|nr:probable bifunctional dTTP/UTP pyrophosphatase/methyltransferase protein isoform X1 [Chiroxiphia lanceolata]